MKTMARETMNSGLMHPEVTINKRCVGCQDCILRCPTEALSMNTESWIAQVDNKLCVGCRQCSRICAFSAITVAGPVLAEPRTKLVPVELHEILGSTIEVRPGYSTMREAVAEANRCLNCPDPTCVYGCPAHNDIPAFIEAVRNQDLPRAREILSATTCLPEVCSRVCNWSCQCEGNCSLALAGVDAVAVGKLERFVADNTPIPPLRGLSNRGKGLSVGIIGSGPAGIGAASRLVSEGAEVTIYESGPVGGVIKWGIPSYVLPDSAVEGPIKALLDAGVVVRTGSKIAPEQLDGLLSEHDAIIAAGGTPILKRPPIPGLDQSWVMNSTEFLTRAKQSLARKQLLPEFKNARILVLGGGNTAVDVARSAARLGGKAVMIHREDERFSLARTDELSEARREGVEIRFSTTIARVDRSSNGLKKVVVLVPTLQKDSKTEPIVVKGGKETIIEVDTVVVATGYGIDRKFESIFGKLPLRQPASDAVFPDRRWMSSGIMTKNDNGQLAWARDYGLRAAAPPRTDKVWVVGDNLVGASSVVGAMAQGRAAALSILEKCSPKPLEDRGIKQERH